MSLKYPYFAFVLVGMLMVSACNRTYDPVPETAQKIFPIVEDQFRIYAVLDTIYQDTSAQGFRIETYYKKEQTGPIETDLLEREVATLWTYVSPDSTDGAGDPVFDFTFDELWTQFKDDDHAERIESNVRYQVLKFPVYGGFSWDGNQFNNIGQQTYTYTNIDTTVVVNGVSYENCVFVTRIPFRDSQVEGFRRIQFEFEVYAPDIGKVEYYLKDYEWQDRDGNGDVDPGEVEIYSRVLHETLIQHN